MRGMGEQVTPLEMGTQYSVGLTLTSTGRARGRAGSVLHPQRGAPCRSQRLDAEGARDFVTEVDRTAERMIADIVMAAEPDGRMIGEELSPKVVTEGLVWIVDPLDG